MDSLCLMSTSFQLTPPSAVCRAMPPLFSYTLLSGPHPTAHPSFLFKKRTESICQPSPGIEKDRGIQLFPPSKSSHVRPVQYRARKQAADSSVGRLLTRAVLYRCTNVAWPDLEFCIIFPLTP